MAKMAKPAKPAKLISFFNHKGGVSKTTTTFNLGWALAETGKRVLIVDGDPQCNLTGTALGLNDDDAFEDFYNQNAQANVVPFPCRVKSRVPGGASTVARCDHRPHPTSKPLLARRAHRPLSV
jgi:hypothetical protein